MDLVTQYQKKGKFLEINFSNAFTVYYMGKASLRHYSSGRKKFRGSKKYIKHKSGKID